MFRLENIFIIHFVIPTQRRNYWKIPYDFCLCILYFYWNGQRWLLTEPLTSFWYWIHKCYQVMNPVSCFIFALYINKFTKPGPVILAWPVCCSPCLHFVLTLVTEYTKWQFLLSLFINRSFNSFESHLINQFKATERNSQFGSRWSSSVCSTSSLISKLIQ